jgi:hypothetical protein
VGFEASTMTGPDLHWWAEFRSPATGETWIVDPTVKQFSNTVLGSPVSRYSRTINELTGLLERGALKTDQLESKIVALHNDMNEGVATMLDYVAHRPLQVMLNRAIAAVDEHAKTRPSHTLELLRETLAADEQLVDALVRAKQS